MPTIDASWRIAVEIAKVRTEQDIADILHEVCKRMGCAWFALSHHIDFLSAPKKGTRVHNYPEDWERWFDEMGLGVSDPVHRESQRRTAGFLWRDIGEYDRPRQGDAEVRERARRHGIFDGLTIPSHLPGEAHGSVSFAWREGHQIPPEALPFAQSIGPFAFEAARRLALPISKTLRPRLTDRQIECLLWTARGKSSWATARILGLTEGTVKEHLRHARARYDAPTSTSLAIRALFDGAFCFGDLSGR